MFVAGRAFAVPRAGSRLLFIFLRGAYDALNIIAPTGNDFYHEARPTIALAKPDATNPNAPIPLNAEWSLHPALQDSIAPFWHKKQIAFVTFAGTDDMSRSHFETQDTIELGQPTGGRRNYGSGFMARLADTLGKGGKPIAFMNQVPLCFHGSRAPIPNLALTNIGKPFNQRQAKLIEVMYRNHPNLAQSAAEGFQTRESVYRAIEREMNTAGRGATSAKGFELSARRIGVLMRDNFNLAFIDVGGWDTHVNQGNATGYLANRIAELGRGLVGLADSLGSDSWKTTTVVVMSEFGRTFRENGSRGTDHGHGSIYWILGGGVSGGRIAGEQLALSPGTLNEGRDLAVLTDYRALIGGLIRRQYGLSSDALTKIFPDVYPRDLSLL
jgi:uncharacterized protein (DUF1501 family)